jgi:protocatechuate 3,4-dioxygenase beta subunit
VTVADGQKLDSLDMRLSRGGVITGRILDETGQPALGATVRLLQYRMVQGERTLAPIGVPGSVSTEITDDRGMYRLYGLPPGEYVVAATPRLMVTGEIRAMTDGEVRAAIQAAQQPPAAVAGRAGGAAPPPVEPREYLTVGFTPVFYPGTTFAASAASVVLGAGDERQSIDFQLQLVRTAKIEGTIITPPGIPPQSVQLVMTAVGPSVAAGALPMSLISRATPGPDGKFSYTSVTPGQYTISARATQPPPGAAPGTPGAQPMGRRMTAFVRADSTAGGPPVVMIGEGGGGPVFWATTEVAVDGQNLSNITLALQPGMTLAGRVQFDGKVMTPPTDLSRTRVSLLPVQAPGGGGVVTVGSMPFTAIDASGTFKFSGITPGRYRLEATSPMEVGTGWRLKSVMVKGREMYDFPLEIGPGEEIADAVVTLTDVTQEVSGTLQDPTGRPAPDYTIVVFPADRQLWASPVNRRIRTARPGTDGRFTVANLPAGSYRIAAVTDIAPGEANDPQFLEQLLAASVPFALKDGEKKVQDLRISGG